MKPLGGRTYRLFYIAMADLAVQNYKKILFPANTNVHFISFYDTTPLKISLKSSYSAFQRPVFGRLRLILYLRTAVTERHQPIVTMNRIGKLYFRYGTMGSAKTAMLLTTAYNFEERGMAYLCFKPVVDTRDRKNVIRSRIGIERECGWIYSDTDLFAVVRKIFEDTLDLPEWILIDEAQFLSTEQVDQLAHVVDDYGINVVCYGLRTDFRSHLFEGSKRLFEIADTIDEIKSTCSCGRKTIVNARIDGKGEIITEGAQVEIGGNDRYMSVCRKCWTNKRIERLSRDRLPFEFDFD